MIVRKCDWCGVTYLVPPSRIKYGAARFHSPECYKSWRRDQAEKTKVEVTCTVCGQKKKIWNSRFLKGKDKTCSKKCEAALKAITRKGKGNPNYVHGNAYAPYCPKFNRKRKDAVRKFFGKRCICCGKHTVENIASDGKQKELAVHHVDHDRDQGCNGRPFNLVPLCMECHSKEQYNQKEYKEYINKTLESGFEWGIWSREMYEIKVMYPDTYVTTNNKNK